ncbi:hypothetical protein PROFUN_02740 [Planoprotostelium fungivorum]|uniref:Uncharacterized protein n=1 Tax=Planoprotostelium fungivorum TaxID=1890364 RepID=A0A2P6NXG0_9EUKA|nr:hypothetical protein PROFUN_02740 [Planoprotostelium fungivorum]
MRHLCTSLRLVFVENQLPWIYAMPRENSPKSCYDLLSASAPFSITEAFLSRFPRVIRAKADGHW